MNETKLKINLNDKFNLINVNLNNNKLEINANKHEFSNSGISKTNEFKKIIDLPTNRTIDMSTLNYYLDPLDETCLLVEFKSNIDTHLLISNDSLAPIVNKTLETCLNSNKTIEDLKDTLNDFFANEQITNDFDSFKGTDRFLVNNNCISNQVQFSVNLPSSFKNNDISIASGRCARNISLNAQLETNNSIKNFSKQFTLPRSSTPNGSLSHQIDNSNNTVIIKASI
jgi:hypothetical protein